MQSLPTLLNIDKTSKQPIYLQLANQLVELIRKGILPAQHRLMSRLLHDGVIQRHLRKSVRQYRQRRDVFCDLLQTQLGNSVEFRIPEGGMAVWTHFEPSISLKMLSERALQKGLYIANGLGHQSPFQTLNAIRMGFASSTESELEYCIHLLKTLIHNTSSI
ncbi:MAG: aminotransferase class I/II-fold pyridoxal phosphate-dependent enzyme [Siphonobacter sp.]